MYKSHFQKIDPMTGFVVHGHKFYIGLHLDKFENASFLYVLAFCPHWDSEKCLQWKLSIRKWWRMFSHVTNIVSTIQYMVVPA